MSDPAFFTSDLQTEQQTVIVKPEKSSTALRFGVILIALFILGSIAYKVYQRKSSQEGIWGTNASISPTPNYIVAQQGKNNAVYWNIFSGVGYSFSYPETYQIETIETNTTGFFDDTSALEMCRTYLDTKTPLENPCETANFTMTFPKKISQSGYKNFIAARKMPEDYKDAFGRYWKTDQAETEAYTYNAALETEDSYYVVTFEANKDKYASNSPQPLYQQILSTFKFTEIKPTPTPVKSTVSE